MVLFGSLPFVPERIFDQMPSSLIPTIYASLIAGFMVKYQDKDIKELLANNGVRES